MKALVLLLRSMLTAVVLCAWSVSGVAAAGPTANFQIDPRHGEVPLSVQFSNGSNGGVAPLYFTWDFGDGASSTERDPTHVYQVPGEFSATLTVTDYAGQTDTKDQTHHRRWSDPAGRATAREPLGARREHGHRLRHGHQCGSRDLRPV